MIETVSIRGLYDRNIVVNDLNGPKSYFSKRILFLINNVSLKGKPINKNNGYCYVPLSSPQIRFDASLVSQNKYI